MSLRWEQVVVAATDPVALGQWWAEALGWAVVSDDPDKVRDPRAARPIPEVLILSEAGAKVASQNRLHLDFRPDDQQSEVRRLIGLGARRIDIGQGDDVSWVVLADPEGNEFCVLRGPIR